jgi:hypothetical protein
MIEFAAVDKRDQADALNAPSTSATLSVCYNLEHIVGANLGLVGCFLRSVDGLAEHTSAAGGVMCSSSSARPSSHDPETRSEPEDGVAEDELHASRGSNRDRTDARSSSEDSGVVDEDLGASADEDCPMGPVTTSRASGVAMNPKKK